MLSDAIATHRRNRLIHKGRLRSRPVTGVPVLRRELASDCRSSVMSRSTWWSGSGVVVAGRAASARSVDAASQRQHHVLLLCSAEARRSTVGWPSVVGGVFVGGVAGWFELEGGVLHVEVSGEAFLELVEQLGDVAVEEAIVVYDDVSAEYG